MGMFDGDKYLVDTFLLSDFEKERFKAILEELEDMGCMVTKQN